MAYDYNSIAVDDYTIALLKFDNQDNPLKDECGNTWTNKVESVYKTDSTVGGYLDLGQNGSFYTESFDMNEFFNDDFTIDFWIKSNGATTTALKDLITCAEDTNKDTITANSGFRTYINANDIVLQYSAKMIYKNSLKNSDMTTGYSYNPGSYLHTFSANFYTLTSWMHIAIVKYYGAIIVFVNGIPRYNINQSKCSNYDRAEKNYIYGKFVNLASKLYVGNRTSTTKKIEFCIKNLRISNIARWTGMENNATGTKNFSTDTLQNEEWYTGLSEDPTGIYKDYYTKSLLKFNKIVNVNNVYKLQDECGFYWDLEGKTYLSTRNSLYKKALHLNGSDSRVTLNTGGLYLGGEDFTIDLWVYRPRTMVNGSVAFCFYNSTNKISQFFCLYLTCPFTNAHMNICYADYKTEASYCIHLGKDDDDGATWKPSNQSDHIAMVYKHDEKVINIYLNGYKLKGAKQKKGGNSGASTDQIEFNFEKTLLDKMFIGGMDQDIAEQLATYAVPNVSAACSINNFRISNIARWTGEFYDGKDRNGADSPGRTLIQNIYESQWPDNLYAYSPIKTDIFTEVLLHFDDTNNPWKDECGHTFNFEYAAVIYYEDTDTGELIPVKDPEIYKPRLTDFHSVYGNSCVSFAFETNNYSQFGWVKYVPSAANPISIGGQDFTIDFWMYSNSNSDYNKPVFKISTWESIEWDEYDDDEDHPVGYNTVIQLSNKYTSADFYTQIEMLKTSEGYKTYPSLEYTRTYDYVQNGTLRHYDSPSIIEADSTTKDFFGGGNVITGSDKSRTFLCGRKVYCAIVYYHFQGLLVYFQNGYPTLQIRTNIPRNTITDIIIGGNGFMGEIDDFRYSDGIARYSGVFNIEPGYPDLTYTEEKSIYTTVVKNDKLHFFLDFDDPKRNTSSPFIDKVRGIEMLNGKDQCVNKVTNNLIDLTNVDISYDESAKKSRYKYAGYFNGTSYLESSRNNKDGNGNQMLVTLPQGDWTIDWFSYDVKSYYLSSGIFCLLPYNSSFNSKSSAFSSKTFIAVHRPVSTKFNLLYIKTSWSRWNNTYTKITTDSSKIYDTIYGLNAMSGTNSTNYTGDTGRVIIGDYGVNQLIHWAIVKQESNISVYRQGIRTFVCDISTAGSFDDFAGTYDLYLGIAPGENKTVAASESNLRNQTNYYTFKGYIDNFRITHEALFKTNFEIGDHPQPDHYYSAFVY